MVVPKAIQRAAISGELAVIKRWIDSGGDVNDYEPNPRLLHLAAEHEAWRNDEFEKGAKPGYWVSSSSSWLN